MAKEGEGDDGEKKPDSKKDDDGEEQVPRSRLVAALKDQEARLSGQITALRDELAKSKEKPADKPQAVSRADLLAAVDEGKMSLAQADQVWEKQITDRATQQATAAASQEASHREAKGRIDDELRRYKEAIPAAWRDGSDERSKVVDEYRHLVSIGMPDATQTELAALRAVYGPIEKIQKSRSQSQRAVEAEEQSGGGGDTDDATRGKGSNYALVKTLSAREKEHYDAQIKAKRYKDWSEVEAELKYANQATRRRMGAKV